MEKNKGTRNKFGKRLTKGVANAALIASLIFPISCASYYRNLVGKPGLRNSIRIKDPTNYSNSPWKKSLKSYTNLDEFDVYSTNDKGVLIFDNQRDSYVLTPAPEAMQESYKDKNNRICQIHDSKEILKIGKSIDDKVSSLKMNDGVKAITDIVPCYTNDEGYSRAAIAWKFGPYNKKIHIKLVEIENSLSKTKDSMSRYEFWMSDAKERFDEARGGEDGRGDGDGGTGGAGGSGGDGAGGAGSGRGGSR